MVFDIDQIFLKWGARVGTDHDRYFVFYGSKVECGGFEKLTETVWLGYGFLKRIMFSANFDSLVINSFLKKNQISQSRRIRI